MIELPQVTLVALDWVNIDGTIKALRTSQKGITFGASKLISPERPSSLPVSILWESCPPLQLRGPGTDDYSHYIQYDLWRHVDTEFCLLVQADGFVIHPELWEPAFLEYDYIGAAWPLLPDAYIDPFGNHQRVGNGGFSLRSSRLLRVPLARAVVWDVNQGDFYRHMDAQLLNEDGNICVHNRHVYEEAGCRFAPVEVAVRFSQEHRVPETRGITPFGFHKHDPRKRWLKRLAFRG